MSVREATQADAGRFGELWEDMLREIWEHHPKVDEGPTRKNVNFGMFLFESYVSGFLDGVCLLWEPKGSEAAQGVLMAGDRAGGPGAVELRWERPAWIHGIYVTPECRRLGGWRALHRAGREPLVKLGFTDVLGLVPAGHEESFRMNSMSGGEPYAILMERSL